MKHKLTTNVIAIAKVIKCPLSSLTHVMILFAKLNFANNAFTYKAKTTPNLSCDSKHAKITW
jgi:hypothetical protein